MNSYKIDEDSGCLEEINLEECINENNTIKYGKGFIEKGTEQYKAHLEKNSKRKKISHIKNELAIVNINSEIEELLCKKHQMIERINEIKIEIVSIIERLNDHNIELPEIIRNSIHMLFNVTNPKSEIIHSTIQEAI